MHAWVDDGGCEADMPTLVVPPPHPPSSSSSSSSTSSLSPRLPFSASTSSSSSSPSLRAREDETAAAQSYTSRYPPLPAPASSSSSSSPFLSVLSRVSAFLVSLYTSSRDCIANLFLTPCHVYRFSQGIQRRVGTRFTVMMLSTYVGLKGLLFALVSDSMLPYMRELGYDGLVYQRIVTVAFVPWGMKGLLGSLSDAFPLGGYHKKFYMLLSSLTGITSLVSLLVLSSHLPRRPPSLSPTSTSDSSTQLLLGGGGGVGTGGGGASSASDNQGGAGGSTAALFPTVGGGEGGGGGGSFLHPAILSPGGFHVTLLGLIYFCVHLQIATVDLMCEGMYSRVMVEKPRVGSDLVTFVNACTAVGAVLGRLIVGPVSDHFGTRPLFLLALPVALQSLIPILWNFLREERVSPPCGVLTDKISSQKSLFVMAVSVALCASGVAFLTLLNPAAGDGGSSTSSDDGGAHQTTSYILPYCVCVSVILIVLCLLCLPSQLAKCNVFFFVDRLLHVSISGALDFFYTASPDCVPDGPHFDYTYYSTFTAIAGTVATWIGLFLFQLYLSSWTYREIFWLTSAVRILASLFDYVMTTRLNIKVLGIPDKFMYLLGDAIILSLVNSLSHIPGVILTSRLCPPKMESTVYAILAGISNFGHSVSTLLGLRAIKAANIRTTPDLPGGCDFSHLPFLILCVHCFLPMLSIPLAMVLLPNKSMSEPLLERRHHTDYDEPGGGCPRRREEEEEEEDGEDDDGTVVDREEDKKKKKKKRRRSYVMKGYEEMKEKKGSAGSGRSRKQKPKTMVELQSRGRTSSSIADARDGGEDGLGFTANQTWGRANNSYKEEEEDEEGEQEDRAEGRFKEKRIYYGHDRHDKSVEMTDHCETDEDEESFNQKLDDEGMGYQCIGSSSSPSHVRRQTTNGWSVSRRQLVKEERRAGKSLALPEDAEADAKTLVVMPRRRKKKRAKKGIPPRQTGVENGSEALDLPSWSSSSCRSLHEGDTYEALQEQEGEDTEEQARREAGQRRRIRGEALFMRALHPIKRTRELEETSRRRTEKDNDNTRSPPWEESRRVGEEERKRMAMGETDDRAKDEIGCSSSSSSLCSAQEEGEEDSCSYSSSFSSSEEEDEGEGLQDRREEAAATADATEKKKKKRRGECSTGSRRKKIFHRGNLRSSFAQAHRSPECVEDQSLDYHRALSSSSSSYSCPLPYYHVKMLSASSRRERKTPCHRESSGGGAQEPKRLSTDECYSYHSVEEPPLPQCPVSAHHEGRFSSPASAPSFRANSGPPQQNSRERRRQSHRPPAGSRPEEREVGGSKRRKEGSTREGSHCTSLSQSWGRKAEKETREEQEGARKNSKKKNGDAQESRGREREREEEREGARAGGGGGGEQGVLSSSPLSCSPAVEGLYMYVDAGGEASIEPHTFGLSADSLCQSPRSSFSILIERPSVSCSSYGEDAPERTVDRRGGMRPLLGASPARSPPSAFVHQTSPQQPSSAGTPSPSSVTKGRGRIIQCSPHLQSVLPPHDYLSASFSAASSLPLSLPPSSFYSPSEEARDQAQHLSDLLLVSQPTLSPQSPCLSPTKSLSLDRHPSQEEGDRSTGYGSSRGQHTGTLTIQCNLSPDEAYEEGLEKFSLSSSSSFSSSTAFTVGACQGEGTPSFCSNTPPTASTSSSFRLSAASSDRDAPRPPSPPAFPSW